MTDQTLPLDTDHDGDTDATVEVIADEAQIEIDVDADADGDIDATLIVPFPLQSPTTASDLIHAAIVAADRPLSLNQICHATGLTRWNAYQGVRHGVTAGTLVWRRLRVTNVVDIEVGGATRPDQPAPAQIASLVAKTIQVVFTKPATGGSALTTLTFTAVDVSATHPNVSKTVPASQASPYALTDPAFVPGESYEVVWHATNVVGDSLSADASNIVVMA